LQKTDYRINRFDILVVLYKNSFELSETASTVAILNKFDNPLSKTISKSLQSQIRLNGINVFSIQKPPLCKQLVGGE
jgi:hypothetical protein